MNRPARLPEWPRRDHQFFLSGLKENQLVVRKRDIKMGFQVISDLKIRTLRYINQSALRWYSQQPYLIRRSVAAHA